MTQQNNSPNPPDLRSNSAISTGQSDSYYPIPILESRSFPEISQLVVASGHRLRTTLICSTAFSILSAAFAFNLVPAQYLASATVRVLQREGYLLTTQQSRSEDASFVRAQQALVTQDQTLSNALKDKRLSDLLSPLACDDPASWLRGQIKAEMSVGSETMSITASSPFAEIAVHASRAVTEAYVAAITEQLRSSRDRRIQELENTASEVDAKLMHQWRLLQSKSGKFGSGNPQSVSISEQLKLESFRENSQRLRSLQFQRAQLELQLTTEKKSKPLAPELSELQLQTAISQHPEIVSLREQVRRVDLKIVEMKQLVQSDSAPQLVRLQTERKHYLASLDQTESKVASIEQKKLSHGLSVQVPTPKSKEMENQLALIDIEINDLRATTTQLETSIVEVSGPGGVELEIIRHEIEREERLADSLWKAIQELRIEARAEPRVALGALPSETNRLSRAKQWKAVSGASALGLALGVLGVGFVEWMSRRIRSADEIVKKVRLQAFDGTSHKNGQTVARALLAQLLLRANPDGSLPSVFITSALFSEPRLRLSIELAEAVVASGRKVLFVACEAYHHSPTTSETRETTDWFSEIRSSRAHGFDYLNSSTGPFVLQRMASKSMTAFLKQVDQQYDSLIVLGPTVLPNAEAVLLASSPNLTVLVAEIGLSRMNHLIAARNQLQLPSVNLLGTVLMPFAGPSTFSNGLLRTCESDPFVADLVRDEVESAVLESVTELRGQITQFDSAMTPISTPHLSPKSRQKQIIKNSRIIE